MQGGVGTTPLVLNDLPEGGENQREISYAKDNDAFVGKLEVSMDRSGENTVAVEFSRQFNGIVPLPGGVILEMIKVEAGDFIMGDDDIDDAPRHRVYLTKDYWLGKYPVTQEQYEAIMGGNPSCFQEGGRYPVERVDWNQAMEFCKRLTEREREAGSLPESYEYSLPTEAQWEYAARGGSKSHGYEYSGSDNLEEVGWYCDNSNYTIHEVGGKKANELGFHDMSGNVGEWCRDRCSYSWGGIETDTYRDGISDPCCACGEGSLRVNRGCSWRNFAWHCRIAFRNSIAPRFGFSTVGFRVALVPIIDSKKPSLRVEATVEGQPVNASLEENVGKTTLEL